jgi:transcriptional regulator with XRE-family HTH domain
MRSKTIVLFPKHQAMLAQVGQQFKLARKRRKLTAQQVAERAGINRTTLYQIEKGNASVSMSAFFNVLRVFNLEDDILKLAADDALGRKLQDLALLNPEKP